ncbi:polysaccharide deacetylase family protein [Paenibacillus sp. ACRRX]|uniref:polysaccharide deacetylase family protein n=1 Tax=unclassified Paenibacillus TaxID=185978 RepID=UPI001EF4A38E|nr:MULTISPECIES: polysaccharide deacetylase family protein [unclassified Paenibacillus]MCG7408170.1 polysaccharide deacetylase family protein [Paenibacillus sp. ACRRX]MDK8181447.1 polysaccharide deacetylase family protein [Paenibacillus sp. UMB4589-SE434]
MLKRGLFTLMIGIFAAGCVSGGAGPKSTGAEEPGSQAGRHLRIFSTGAPELAGGTEMIVRKPASLTLAQLREKYRSNFILQGPSSPKRVALTFDDVPDRYYTVQILDLLKRYHAKATFFIVGNRAEQNPDIVKRIVEEGHAIGNHSYTHANLPKLSDIAFRNEVIMTQQAVKRITGQTMHFIRPPYGNINDKQIKWLISQKLKIVNWNVDSLDWKGLNADQVEANIMGNVRSGSIVLQHGAGGKGEDLSGTVGALQRVIQQLRESGIELVTIPHLLAPK